MWAEQQKKVPGLKSPSGYAPIGENQTQNLSARSPTPRPLHHPPPFSDSVSIIFILCNSKPNIFGCLLFNVYGCFKMIAIGMS